APDVPAAPLVPAVPVAPAGPGAPPPPGARLPHPPGPPPAGGGPGGPDAPAATQEGNGCRGRRVLFLLFPRVCSPRGRRRTGQGSENLLRNVQPTFASPGAWPPPCFTQRPTSTPAVQVL